MFVQVMEGKVADRAGLRRQMDRWDEELKPGAVGYLGSTGGITDAGDCILVARFAREADARRNSDRPEQGAWWEETEACFDGPVRFHESTEVMVMRHGDADRARFVQVMEGHVTDMVEARRLQQEADEVLRTARPDLIETITAFFDDDRFAEVAYFTSMEEARRAEQSEIPEELRADFERFQQTMAVDRWLDLREPWLTSA